jgi:membrane-bound serine protease (ClpP class)
MRKLLFTGIALLLNSMVFGQTVDQSTSVPVAIGTTVDKSKVTVMDIKAEIDPRMLRYVKLALSHAEKTKADYVIVDMDTFGGGLAEAKDIVKLILNFKKPVWVFINTNAISAGAFISIACDSIYMSPGSSIGASSVVDGEGKFASAKVQSAMRSFMRSTAESNNRDPRIAESMVGVSDYANHDRSHSQWVLRGEG